MALGRHKTVAPDARAMYKAAKPARPMCVMSNTDQDLSSWSSDDSLTVIVVSYNTRELTLAALRGHPDPAAVDLLEGTWALEMHAVSAARVAVFGDVRSRQLGNLQASSLMNDLGYVSRITQSFRNVLLLGLAGDNELIREVRRLGGGDDGPLIQLYRP